MLFIWKCTLNPLKDRIAPITDALSLKLILHLDMFIIPVVISRILLINIEINLFKIKVLKSEVIIKKKINIPNIFIKVINDSFDEFFNLFIKFELFSLWLLFW